MIRYGASFAGASATLEERSYRVDHGIGLGRRHSWIDRERKDTLRMTLRIREVADLVAEVRVRSGQVYSDRVVSAGADPALTQEVHEPSRIVSPDDEQMPGRGTVRSDRR